MVARAGSPRQFIRLHFYLSVTGFATLCLTAARVRDCYPKMTKTVQEKCDGKEASR